jgi:hypothetical protein
MSVQQFFPFVPDYMDWEAWNGNLIIFYSEEPVPFHPETEWQITAKSVAQLPTFSAYPVPDPDLYNDWQSWANEFTLIINGPSK